MPNHELFDFLRQSSELIQDEYGRITRRSREDPGTAGDEGEENWRKLLTRWLPKAYQVVTKGRVLFRSGQASPHMDVLVLSPEYPNGLLDSGQKLYLAGGVIAAFECKLTLRQADIAKAFENARALSDGVPKRWGSPYRELHRPFIYGLLAHSHEWKSGGSRPQQNVTDGLKAGLNALEHPGQILDLVCVADLGTWTSTRTLTAGYWEVDAHGSEEWKNPATRSVYAGFDLHERPPHLSADTSFTNVGAMMVDLLMRIGRERPELRPFVNYFRSVPGLAGNSHGRARVWSTDRVLSRAVEEELARRNAQPPSNPGLIREADDGDWSEWDSHLGW
jgi:hypothetical protein